MFKVLSLDPPWVCWLSWRRSLCDTIPISFIQGLPWPVPWPMPPFKRYLSVSSWLRRKFENNELLIATRRLRSFYLATSSWCRIYFFILSVWRDDDFLFSSLQESEALNNNKSLLKKAYKRKLVSRQITFPTHFRIDLKKKALIWLTFNDKKKLLWELFN